MAYYGVAGGSGFSPRRFVGHVKPMFLRGTESKPEPPVAPIRIGKPNRGVELASASASTRTNWRRWMKQAATMPFAGGKKR